MENTEQLDESAREKEEAIFTQLKKDEEQYNIQYRKELRNFKYTGIIINILIMLGIMGMLYGALR